jgi:DNA-binding NarL/FixJ family response regulator
MANLVLVDDHVLLRKGLAELVKNFGNTILFEADNGRNLFQSCRNMRCLT